MCYGGKTTVSAKHAGGEWILSFAEKLLKTDKRFISVMLPSNLRTEYTYDVKQRQPYNSHTDERKECLCSSVPTTPPSPPSALTIGLCPRDS